MFRHLLVPLDGSRLAEAALVPTAALARRLGARVTLLHVLERAAPQTVHGERHLTRAEDAEVYLRAAAATLESGGMTVERIVDGEMTDVARTIASRAASLHADLIVICTHGEGGFRELLFGSVAQQVLGGGAIPVLLVHPTAGPPQPFVCRTILVPLDQTAPSEAALPAAASLARALTAVIVLSHVVPTVTTMPGERGAAATLMPTAAAAMLDAEVERAAGYLQNLIPRLTGDGVDAQARVERGEPVQALLALVDARQVDLVVMATHARAGMAAVWTGSVAARFLPRVSVPVLLVRTPAD